MHIHNIHHLLQDERFRKIIWKKRQLSVFFALGIIVLFFGFILVISGCERGHQSLPAGIRGADHPRLRTHESLHRPEAQGQARGYP